MSVKLIRRHGTEAATCISVGMGLSAAFGAGFVASALPVAVAYGAGKAAYVAVRYLLSKCGASKRCARNVGWVAAFVASGAVLTDPKVCAHLLGNAVGYAQATVIEVAATLSSVATRKLAKHACARPRHPAPIQAAMALPAPVAPPAGRG